MDIEFDPDKDAINREKHGLSLSQFRGFDTSPMILVDARLDYGEERFRAFGRIDGEGYCVVFTNRSGAIRVISFRRAHDKEMRRYE